MQIWKCPGLFNSYSNAQWTEWLKQTTKTDLWPLSSLNDSCLFLHYHSSLNLPLPNFRTETFAQFILRTTRGGCGIFILLNSAFQCFKTKQTISEETSKLLQIESFVSLSTILLSHPSSSSVVLFYEKLRVPQVSVVVEAPRYSWCWLFLSRVEVRWVDCWPSYWRHWKTIKKT